MEPYSSKMEDTEKEFLWPYKLFAKVLLDSIAITPTVSLMESWHKCYFYASHKYKINVPSDANIFRPLSARLHRSNTEWYW